MNQTILAALALFLAVGGQAQQADDASQLKWLVVNRENGVVEEGFQVNGMRVGQWTIIFPHDSVWSGPYVDGERHGLWHMIDGDTSYTTYYVQGTDIDNAFRVEVDDVESLLEFMDAAGVGVDELVFNYGRETYLHAAMSLFRPIEVIRTLLDMGADPNQEGLGRASPMRAAIPYGRCSSYGLEVLDELVKAGGDVTVKDGASATLMHEFALVRECNNELARAFVVRLTAFGLDIEARDQNGSTPLNEAARQLRSVSVVRAMIEFGADVNSRDRLGRTPLHNVISDPPPEDTLLEEITPLIYAQSDREIARQQSDIGLLLLRNGADPNLLDADGMAPLDGIEEDSPLGRTRFYRHLVRRTENE